MLSIIIPFYNEEAELPDLLASLQAQTDKDFNAVLIDNNSTDKSKKIITDFKKYAQFKIVVTTERKTGKRNAVEKGVKVSTKLDTTILGFSDADAYFDSNWVKTIKKVFENKNIGWAYCNEYFKNDRLDEVPNFSKCLNTYTAWREYTKRTIGGYMVMNNCAVRASAYQKISGLDKDWQKSLDTLLTLKLLSNNFEGKYFDSPIWVSPRRLLDNNNLQKWCKDEDIRQFVILNKTTVWKPIRVDNVQYVKQGFTDIPKALIKQTLTRRSTRLIRRLIVLTIFEKHSGKVTVALSKFFKNTNCDQIYLEWKKLLPDIRKEIFDLYPDTYNRYALADRIIRKNCNELINQAGSALIAKYDSETKTHSITNSFINSNNI